MRIAIEKGETLEVIILDKNREVGRLTLELSAGWSSETSKEGISPVSAQEPLVSRKRAKRVLSEEARRRIAEAQKKRWAKRKQAEHASAETHEEGQPHHG